MYGYGLKLKIHVRKNNRYGSKLKIHVRKNNRYGLIFEIDLRKRNGYGSISKCVYGYGIRTRIRIPEYGIDDQSRHSVNFKKASKM